MKSTQILTTTKLLLAILVFSFLASGVATAQNTTFRGTFQLTDQVRWGKAVLLPGAYTLEIASNQMPVQVIIRSSNGKVAAIASTTITNDLISKNSSILVTGEAGERQVRSLNLPQLGFSLKYQPRPTEKNADLAQLKTQSVVSIATR